MTDLGLRVLDRTIQTTNEWLKDLMQELHTEDRQEAYHALRSVLFSLRDRLPTDESAKLAAQLPMLVRGLYYEGYVPSEQPKTYRTFDEWHDEVASYYNVDETPDVERVSEVVFGLLKARLDEGVADKVHNALPESVRRLWPEEPIPAAGEG